MDMPYYLIGDDAYKAGGNVVTPFPGANLPREKDDFNYVHSSCRMTIERSFGVSKVIWGVFIRPSPFTLDHLNNMMVECTMILHNLVIDDPCLNNRHFNVRFTGNYYECSDIHPGDNLDVLLNDTLTPTEIDALPDNCQRKR